MPASSLLLEQAMKTLLQDSDSVLLITNSQFVDKLDAIKRELPAIAEDRYILTDGPNHAGYLDYHAVKSAAGDKEPKGIVVNPDDVFNIMYSSGTTGLPKGIVHTHYIRCMYATSFAAAFRMTPESVTLHALSLIHI